MSYEVKNSPVYGKILYKDGRPVIVNYDTAQKMAEKLNGQLQKVFDGRYLIKLPETANSIEECGCGSGSSELDGMITIQPPQDEEVQMARQELFRTAKLAMMLHEMLKGGNIQDLDGWVQRKLTRAADYIESVFDYLDYEMRYPSEMMEADAPPQNAQQAMQQASTIADPKEKALVQQQIKMQADKQKTTQAMVKMARVDANGRPMPNTMKAVPGAQVEIQRRAGFHVMGEDASAGASSSGGVASSMGGGNGFLNGGPGTVTRAKKRKKTESADETGPKFTGYWKGSDKGKPGKKMVGSSS